MPINGINLPSIAGVLGFKDFSNQLNNAKTANDWEKVEAIAKVLSNKLSLIDEIANICYDKNI